MEKPTLWIILGTIFIIFLGTAMHFAYSSTGWLLFGLVAPVNESPWEHLKLSFWPAILFLIFEYFFMYKKYKPHNFHLGRTVGILLMPAIILIIFYSYTAFTPDHESILAVDISSFIVAIIIGQLVSLKFYRSKLFSEKANKYSILALIVWAAILLIFTFYPPHLLPFQDPKDLTYGIFRIP